MAAPPRLPAPASRARAVLTFAAVGAVGSGLTVLFFLRLLGPPIALAAVGLATIAAALSAWLLASPLARARQDRSVKRAVLWGITVVALAVPLFAVAFALADHGAGVLVRGGSWTRLAETVGHILVVGVMASPFLAIVGGLAGAFYVWLPRTV